MVKKRKIGIMGGTFNPIHMGHLIIAELARETFELEEVIFVPDKNPPHKQEQVIEASHRYKMTELAIANNKYFTISDVELKRSGYSYTIDTILHFKKQFGENTEFYFICGTDSIQDLPNWKYIDKLLTICHFIGATRPDGSETIENIIKYFGKIGEEKIHLFVIPKLEISATDLRNRLYHNKSVRYIVPEKVRKYIADHKIYKK